MYFCTEFYSVKFNRQPPVKNLAAVELLFTAGLDCGRPHFFGGRKFFGAAAATFGGWRST